MFSVGCQRSSCWSHKPVFPAWAGDNVYWWYRPSCHRWEMCVCVFGLEWVMGVGVFICHEILEGFLFCRSRDALAPTIARSFSYTAGFSMGYFFVLWSGVMGMYQYVCMAGFLHSRGSRCPDTYKCQSISSHWKCLTHWGRDKWPPFSRRHFETHFLEWKYWNFD